MVPPTRRQALIGVAAVLALLVLAGLLIRTHQQAAGAWPHSAVSTTTASFSSRTGAGTAGAAVGAERSGGVVLVDVAGAVRRPGVYELRDGDRVIDALTRAGGPLPGAQLAAVNRAARLVDGQQLMVPAQPPAGAVVSTAADAAGIAGASVPVSINTADAAALDALQGIGPLTAQKIVADRTANGPFRTIDDLDRVPGVGPATVESLRAAVTL